MPRVTPSELAARVGAGLLSFPVTHFNQDYAFHDAGYREHIAWLLEWGPAALFAAGGTGEFFSLNLREVNAIVAAAVSEVAGRMPVIAGCGYGTEIAIEIATGAEQAGADGILLLPPYLTGSEQHGLAEHIERVCKSVSLGVIYYSRDNAVLHEDTLARLCERCPNLIGYKDGLGDVELLVRVRAKMGDRLVYIGGLPTAETFAVPYLEMGVSTYSSAIFNFLPGFAQDFYGSVRRRDHAAVNRSLARFVLPYIALRNRRKGYAVSIVKAGMKVVGRPAGPTRPPLSDLTFAELAELSALIGSVSLREHDAGEFCEVV